MIKKSTLTLIFIVFVMSIFVLGRYTQNNYLIYISLVISLGFLCVLIANKYVRLGNKISIFLIFLISIYTVLLFVYFGKGQYAGYELMIGLLVGSMVRYMFSNFFLPKKSTYTRIVYTVLPIYWIGIAVSGVYLFASSPRFLDTYSFFTQDTEISVSTMIDTIKQSNEHEVEELSEPRSFSLYFTDIEEITFGDFIPLLWERYTDSDVSYLSQVVDFSYITRQSVLYPSFVYALNQNMIGINQDPDQVMKCKHLLIMMGLAESWDIQDGSDIVADYRSDNRATKILNQGCKSPDQLVLGVNLP